MMGPLPTGITLPAVLVAVEIGVTLLDPSLATKAVEVIPAAPAGVASGNRGTRRPPDVSARTSSGAVHPRRLDVRVIGVRVMAIMVPLCAWRWRLTTLPRSLPCLVWGLIV